jgi:hypothetical protein
MGKYMPTYIKAMQEGLVQERVNFILPDDAYPVLENAYLFRERIRRKSGCDFLGRFRRVLTAQDLGNSSASPWSFNIFTLDSIPEANPSLEIGSTVITVSTDTFTDLGNGTLQRQDGNVASTINYATGDITLVMLVGAGNDAMAAFNYYPNLPVMGLRLRETNSISTQQTVGFDTTYAYQFAGSNWQEFIPGTTWTGLDYNFFWSTNYWVDGSNNKLFWVTNFSGTSGDPIRYTNGPSGSWTDFAPQVDGTNYLEQCLTIVPYRSRLVVCNTLEGTSLAGATSFPQRIRWAAIGNPLTTKAWRDDVPGQGGYIDVPTAEDITSVGFVRDNLVIFCERSTWQLRYTGRSIQPFQLEKVNTELGADSTFSSVQFDTSLVGIGDKGIIQCDSFSSKRIDIKIPDLVFNFNNQNQGVQRVQGIRDFIKRLAYWTYPYVPDNGLSPTYPNRRLVYNYENDSWAIFTDSITSLGTFQPATSATWQDTVEPWSTQNYPWVSRPSLLPTIIAGNQKGFTFYIDSQIEGSQADNDPTLDIEGITGNGSTSPVSITITNHNLDNFSIVEISGIITGSDFADMNGQVYQVEVTSGDAFTLWVYDSKSQQFSMPYDHASGNYIGGGVIAVRDNFRVQSKKFNFLDEGQNIQLGFIDILLNTTDSGAISLNAYIDYNDSSPVNQLPQNISPDSLQPDTFFNTTVLTSQTSGINSEKCWQRAFCAARGNFITVEWTLSPSQMNGDEQKQDVQIFSQILWMRKAGRQLVNA